MSSLTIFPPRIVNRTTRASRPSGATTRPTLPSMSARRAVLAPRERASDSLADSRAPRTIVALPDGSDAASRCTSASGSSNATRPSKSFERAAARNASTSRRSRVVFFGAAPFTLRRARLASCRAVVVSAWRESPLFSEAERAALALTEAATRLSDRSDPVPDEVWQEAARCYDEAALAALVLHIAQINLWNRINVTVRQVVTRVR